jgi:hypothetical protein
VEFTYNVKADPFADVPVEDDVNYPIITELIYKIEHMPANEDIRQANEATRQSQEASRVAAENSRVSEFNVIKTAYDTASHDNTVIELVNARKGEVDLETKIDKIDASLAEIVTNKDTALPGQVLTSNGNGTATFKSSVISDNITSTSTTWSSTKINTELEKMAQKETVDLLQNEVIDLKTKVDNSPGTGTSNTVLSSTADGSIEQGYWIAGGAKTTDNSSYRTKAPIIASDDKLIAECNTTPVKIQFTYYDSSGALISSDGAWNVGVGGVFYMAKPNGTYSVNVTIIPLSLGNFPANSVINVKSASKLPSDYSVEQGYWLGSPALYHLLYILR